MVRGYAGFLERWWLSCSFGHLKLDKSTPAAVPGVGFEVRQDPDHYRWIYPSSIDDSTANFDHAHPIIQKNIDTLMNLASPDDVVIFRLFRPSSALISDVADYDSDLFGMGCLGIGPEVMV